MVERTDLKLKRKIPRAAKAAGSIGLAFAAVGSLAPNCSGGENKGNQPNPESLKLPLKSLEYKFPWADGETWYLTSGPHFDGLSGKVKYALDFAPEDVLPCKTGDEVMEDWSVTASASGKVVVSGIDTDRKNEAHSIVVIEDEDGKGFGYMHLANIAVSVDDKVEQGDILGNPSCEFPPGGKNTGAHLHFFAVDGENPEAISGISISGWEANEDTKNYNGTLTKKGEDTRTADTRRCGPDAEVIKKCGDIRNDLTNDEDLQLAATVALVPTIAGVSTIESVIINTSELQKTSTPEEEVAVGWQQATEKTQLFVNLLLSGTPEDLQRAYEMQMTREQRDAVVAYYNVASLDTIKSCSDEMHKGEFELMGLSKYVTNVQPVLTETDRINKERGLLAPDKYAIGVAFRDRKYNYSSNSRGGFRDYQSAADGTFVGFQDVGGGNLMISETPLCLTGPLAKVVGQSADR